MCTPFWVNRLEKRKRKLKTPTIAFNFSMAPNRKRKRRKVLLLGMSHPCVEGQIRAKGVNPDILEVSLSDPTSSNSVEQVVECVSKGILTEMDARDLARCRATQKVHNVDVYTVSQENAAVYDVSRHLYANFNRGNFCRALKRAFGEDVQFTQIILDYFWIPAGWNVQHWSRNFFETTLPAFVKNNMLAPLNKGDAKSKAQGVIYLPFCLHCFKEVVNSREVLSKYYTISFVRKHELREVSLWAGTQTIDAKLMQACLGKQINQEELYCTFGPQDVQEAIDDPYVNKKEMLDILRCLEDFNDIRMIKLRPHVIIQHSHNLRNRAGTKQEAGGLVGLVDPSMVERGFGQYSNIPVKAISPVTVTPRSTGSRTDSRSMVAKDDDAITKKSLTQRKRIIPKRFCRLTAERKRERERHLIEPCSPANSHIVKRKRSDQAYGVACFKHPAIVTPPSKQHRIVRTPSS